MRRWAITVTTLVIVATACSAGSAERPVSESVPGGGAATVEPELVPTGPPSATTVSTPGESPSSVAATSPTVVQEPDVAVSTVASAASGNESGSDEIVDTEDPSFVLGPDVVLDLDVARFPEDDAGIGGADDPSVDADQPAGDDSEPGSPDASLTGWAGVDQYLESVLIRPGNTAASVAVSIGGDVVHRAAFGLRDPDLGDQAEPQDRFRIASISKPITAITVMALVEDGVIELDEPLGDVVAQHVGLAGANGASADLSFRQLLTHRTGFGKYDGTFFRGAADDCIDAARTGLASGAGGGGYVYSNMNFCVAGLAIEAVTGLGYEQAVYRHLLTPLGISGMRLAPTFDPGPDEVQHVTTPGRNYMETLGAAGAWIATPTDLVKIFDSLDVDTGGFKPLAIETVLQMLIPPGGTLGQRGYGLGVISYGDNRYGHTGTIESTHAMVLNRGDGVIWSITVAGQFPGESTSLERIMNEAFEAGGFVAG